MSERQHSNHEKNRGFNKSRGLHKAFNKGVIPILMKSSELPQIKNRASKILLLFPEYCQKCTDNKTINAVKTMTTMLGTGSEIGQVKIAYETGIKNIQLQTAGMQDMWWC